MKKIMKKIILFLLLIIPFLISAQIVGGSGQCKINGSPNSVANLQVLNQSYSCSSAIDTLTGDEWVYNVSLAQGSRWENKTLMLSNKWKLGGNTLTANTVFGTNSDHDLVFIRNGVRAGLVNSSLANTSFGVSALQSNTTGYNNTANGLNALYYNTTGNSNTANGLNALYYNTTGNYNTAFGLSALQSNTTGYYNTANGVSALQSNTTGYNNTANGLSALQSNTTGNSNTANGVSALQSNTTGYYNTANGVNALQSNTTGYNNTANGVSALQSNTTGNSNTANGVNALQSNTTGNSNTANGVNALHYGKTGSNNTVLLSRGDGIVRSIIADSSMNNSLVLGAGENIRIYSDSLANTGFGTTTPTNKLHIEGTTNPIRAVGLVSGVNTDSVVTVDATGVFRMSNLQDIVKRNVNNIFTVNQTINGITVGRSAGNTTNSLAIGQNALASNTTGSTNTAIGTISLLSNTTGSNNTAVGSGSLYSNDIGSQNVAVGQNSLLNNSIGNTNTSIGQGSLYNNIDGNGNTAIGQNSMDALINGDNNTAIGKNANVQDALTNATAIGYNANVDSDNSLVLGSNVNVGIGTSSPVYKLDINAISGGTGNPIRLLGLQTGTITDSIVTSASGVLKRMSLADLSVSQIIKSSNTVVNIPSITGMGTVGTVSVTVTGAVVGMQVSASPRTNVMTSGVSAPIVYVSAADTVTFSFSGLTVGANGNISSNWDIVIQK
jgi:hypothetical protein